MDNLGRGYKLVFKKRFVPDLINMVRIKLFQMLRDILNRARVSRQ